MAGRVDGPARSDGAQGMGRGAPSRPIADCDGGQAARRRRPAHRVRGGRPSPATLHLTAAGVCVSVRGHDLFDITQALDGLPAQLARLDTRREERRLVYSEGTWRIDP